MMTDLTITDALADPMIALMLDADHISPRSFAQLLESAARVLARENMRNGEEGSTGRPRTFGSNLQTDHWNDLAV